LGHAAAERQRLGEGCGGRCGLRSALIVGSYN
jgi:hypothetical protein